MGAGGAFCPGGRAAGRLLQVSHRTFLSWARQTQEK